MGKRQILVNTDGQVVVTERFIGEEVLLQLDLERSLKLALDVLRAHGIRLPEGHGDGR